MAFLLLIVLIVLTIKYFKSLKSHLRFINKRFFYNNINRFKQLLDDTQSKKSITALFDPYEEKLLKAIFKIDSDLGLDINSVNEILNLNKFSKENQRQRRHITIKELNLKLFILTGQRESIIRVSSIYDKRIKYYKIHKSLYKVSIQLYSKG
jgi:hypothetical protein